MLFKIALYFVVLVFALPLLAMAIKATIAIIGFLITVGFIIFCCVVVWVLFSAVYKAATR